MTDEASRITIRDPFGAAADPLLPTAAAALDAAVALEAFKHGLPRLAGDGGRTLVRSIEVIRHKPGKRAVINYRVRVRRTAGPSERVMLIGKIRARRYGNEGYRLADAIWNAGFDSESADGVPVPEPIGHLPELRMWLQRKVRGAVAGRRLVGADGVILCRRIVEAAHKLHRAGVPSERTHTMADELRILHECLSQVARSHPGLATRLERLRAACDRLGHGVPAPAPCGVHRDFYPAQIIVDGARLWLIDFDLYCLGDPALDIGNFIGHGIEEGLRRTGKADAWAEQEGVMEERFAELNGSDRRPSVRAYTTLTLARLVYLSTQFPDRAPFTERLLELTEQRLATHGRL